MKIHSIWKFPTFLLLSICFLINKANATHIRAGEIIAVRTSTSTLTYRFSIIGYTDTGSSVEFGGGEIDFGDGTTISIEEGADFGETIPLGDDIAYNIFEIEHTFQAPGSYTVRFNERNRNEGVRNMSNSVDTPFYVETTILIDPFLGLNNTPVFLVPPVDKAAVGVKFIHNPGAYDPDGDSLSYELTIPKQSFQIEVNNYLSPIDPSFYLNFVNGNEAQDGIPTFGIDEMTGDLVWDAPGLDGEYNVAFIVHEWRKVQGEWFRLGSVTRDMQIIVEESDNKRPEILAPPDLCVEAGTLVEEIITGTDPDGDDVKVEVFGGPFQFDINAPVLDPQVAFRPTPSNVTFRWQTDCNMVRRRPYDFRLKVTDFPTDDAGIQSGPKLVDFKNWNILIVGPAPTGLTVSLQPQRRMRLDWDEYTCGSANKLQIWRRVDSFPFVAEECVVGIPANSGYELVDTIDNWIIDENNEVQFISTYTDTNNDIGLAPGANYCYRIVAAFPEPAGGESYASDESCEVVLATAPVTLNVDIRKTDRDIGEIYVRWTEPFDLDPVVFPGPYTYQVVRATGFDGEENLDTVAVVSGLEYTDIGVNTIDRVHNYRIHVYNNGGNDYIDSSLPASSVRLDPIPGVTTISLSWVADVPWSNISADFPTHDVYRDRVDDFEPEKLFLIGQANVGIGGLNYVDDGTINGMAGDPLSDQVEYCYYVETKGTYGNAFLATEMPLLNKSQIACAQPNDEEPPCAPFLESDFACESILDNQSCSFTDYSNRIFWNLNTSQGCDDDVRSFNIYFSLSGPDGEFEFIDNVVDLEYVHTGIDSFKGCYRISAVDRSGNESELSEIVCNDNCPNIVMPNAFTPNGDGINDVYTPFNDMIQNEPVEGWVSNVNCPRFVESLKFTVFDRTGGTVFFYDSNKEQGEGINSILINWDGTSDGGRNLASGVYYYGLEVQFDRLDPKDGRVEYNGWLQLIR